MYYPLRKFFYATSVSLVILISGVCATARAQGQAISFSATGDVPYSVSEVTVFQQQVANHNKYSPSAFFVHVGDIISGSESCDESKYANVANIMKGLAVPAYIALGDNESVDCSNPTQGMGFFLKYFSNYEQNFCGAPFTEHQSGRPENWAFVMNGVLFIGINNAYGGNSALQQAADWVAQQFAAKASQVRAAAVFAHYSPSTNSLFSTPFRQAAATLNKPVLFLHGHGHSWSTSYPFPEQNILRVQVNKGGSEDPVEVTVTTNMTSPATAFILKRNPWTSKTIVNMPPCVDAGPDRAITSLTTTLQGGAVDDGIPNGSLTTTWSKVSGPGTVAFVNPNSLTTTASFGTSGTYVLRLTANDGQLQKSDEVTIAINSVLTYPPIVSSFNPASGASGSLVTIVGNNFSGTYNVAFNGTSATNFTVDSPTQISATVPTGATTGKITVTNSDGVGTSVDDFVVSTGGGGSGLLTFYPAHDTYVHSLNATANFGAATELRVETNSASDMSRIYFKFEVSGLAGQVQSAKLQLNCTDGSSNGGAIFLVSNAYQGTSTPWVENALNWNNAPTVSGNVLSSLGSVSSGQTVELDVKSAISGNGAVSFAMTSSSSNSAMYRSKEGTIPPKLIVQALTAPAGDAPVVSAFAPASGTAATEVTITGSKFIGATAVNFNGNPAAFTVGSDTEIHATVPAAATTGKISVTNSVGTGSSANDFVLQYSLTANTIGSGSLSLNPAGGVYNAGTVVTVTATPAAGYQFNGWSGDLTGTTNPATLTMNANKSVTATFIATPPPTQYALTINTQGSGSVVLNPPGGSYNTGTVVTVTATPAAGYQFSGWSGDLTGSTNPASITMNGQKSATATFTEVGSGGGSTQIAFEESQSGTSGGTTTVATSGQLVGVSGHLYLAAISTKSKVAVTGISGLGLSWSLVRAQCAGRNQTGVEVWRAVGTSTTSGAVTATFASAPSSAVITVSRYSGIDAANPIGSVVSGNTTGLSGTCSGGTDNASYSFNLSTTVNGAMVYGAAAMRSKSHTPGFGFTERAEINGPGGSSSAASVATQDKGVTNAGSTTLNGSFDSTVDWAVVGVEVRPGTGTVITQYTLATNVVGSGSVGLSPAGGVYNAGSTVGLTATPAAGFQFSGWSGDLTGTSNPATLTMTSNKNVTATFTAVPPTQYTLAVNTVGSGSVGLSPAGGVYNAGSTVGLTATPAAGYQFSGWSGDLTGTSNPATITMTSNKNVTATFTAVPPTQYTLAVNTVGSGSVGLSPAGGVYNAGSTVSLTATPASGFQFSGWSGDLTGTNNPATITMTSNKNVTATFSSSSGEQIVLEEIKTGGSSSTTTVTTATSLMGVNDQLYLAAVSAKSNVAVTSVSGLGLSWSPVKAQCAGRNQTGVAVWMAIGTPSGNGAVTATFASAPSSAVIAVSRYSGVEVGNPIGNVASGNTTGTNGTCSGGTDNLSYSFNLTTTINAATVYSAAAMRNKIHTPGGGYAEQAEVFFGSNTGSKAGLAVQDKSVASASTVAVDGSFDSAVDWAVVAVEIKPRSGLAKQRNTVVNDDATSPQTILLEPNYPNPFNPETRIRFSLGKAGLVELSVFDTNGKLVRNLIAQSLTVGHHEVRWDGRNAAGERVASGNYIYRLSMNGEIKSKVMALVK